MRWLTDRLRGVSTSEAETETSPGVLLSSGYIAGGTLCGLLIGFLAMAMGGDVGKYFFPGNWAIDDTPIFGGLFTEEYGEGKAAAAKLLSVALFAVLAMILLYIGVRKSPEPNGEPEEPSG